jgi:hypothetical protein
MMNGLLECGGRVEGENVTTAHRLAGRLSVGRASIISINYSKYIFQQFIVVLQIL